MERATTCTSVGTADRKYDLAVAYRICPKVAKSAQSLPFGNNKLRQAEICLRTFRHSLGSLRVKLWAILDGCTPEYDALFGRYFPAEDLVFVRLNAASWRATYAKALEILLAQQDAENVYFAEDDYLYLPGRFPLMLNFLRNGEGVDFVTPYDHYDYYRLDLHRVPEWLTVFENRHWRTAGSTCMTFLTRKGTLAKYKTVFRANSRRSHDCEMWLSLTKRRVFNPLAMLRYLARRESYRRVVPKAWLFFWWQILFGRTVKLWVPVLGIATHLAAGLMSPGIDWLALMQKGTSGDEALGPSR
jgi:hypothetical protein